MDRGCAKELSVSYVRFVADRKQLNPGDLVLGLGEDINPRMRSGVIVAIAYDARREYHFGCEYRLLILWNEPVAILSEECDCGIMVPLDLGL